MDAGGSPALGEIGHHSPEVISGHYLGSFAVKA